MRTSLDIFKSKGVNKVIFGNIFLQDLKEYRQKQLAKTGMEGIFPLWMEPTKDLTEEFIVGGKIYRPIENPEKVCSLDNSHPPPRRKARGNWFCELSLKPVARNVSNG